MEVAFEFTPQDYLDWSEHWALTSAQGHATMRTGRVTLVSLAGVIALLLAMSLEGWFFKALGVFVMGLVAVVWWVTYPATFRGSSRKSAERVVRDSRPTIFGPRRFVFDEKGLRFSGPAQGGYVYWTAVDHVEAAKQAVYVYLAANTAHVIPRRAFPEPGTFESFAGQLVAWHEEAGECIRIS